VISPKRVSTPQKHPAPNVAFSIATLLLLDYFHWMLLRRDCHHPQG
jgi:hypothetical protein